MKNEKKKIFIANLLKQFFIQYLKIDPDSTEGYSEIPIGFLKVSFSKSHYKTVQPNVICISMQLFENNKTEQNIIRNLQQGLRLRDFEDMSANSYNSLLEEIFNNLKSNNDLYSKRFGKTKAYTSATNKGKTMKPVNEELKKDIYKLKFLHAKKDKSEFNVFRDEIMCRHSISMATVYRELKKDTPGEYKIPNYNAAAYNITEREIMMVRELLLGGRQHNEIIKIMARELEIPYNWDRFNKARELSESDEKFLQSPMESAFARNGYYFVQQLLGIEHMMPGSFAEIQLSGTKLKFSRESYEILQLLIMKDNPPADDSMNTAQLADEVIQDKLMRIGVNRQLARMTLNPKAGSSFAMKNLLYIKEMLGRKKISYRRKEKIPAL